MINIVIEGYRNIVPNIIYVKNAPPISIKSWEHAYNFVEMLSLSKFTSFGPETVIQYICGIASKRISGEKPAKITPIEHALSELKNKGFLEQLAKEETARPLLLPCTSGVGFGEPDKKYFEIVEWHYFAKEINKTLAEAMSKGVKDSGDPLYSYRSELEIISCVDENAKKILTYKKHTYASCDDIPRKILDSLNLGWLFENFESIFDATDFYLKDRALNALCTLNRTRLYP